MNIWTKLFGKRKINKSLTSDIFVKQILENIYCKNKGYTIYLTQERYYLVDKDRFEYWLNSDFTNYKKYTKEFFDCAHFAFQLLSEANKWCPGIALFWVSVTREDGSKHAMNLLIDKKGDTWLIEPQNDIIERFNAKYDINLIIK